jgi:tetrahydromethanopterin S-methyltransferase subunit G
MTETAARPWLFTTNEMVLAWRWGFAIGTLAGALVGFVVGMILS